MKNRSKLFVCLLVLTILAMPLAAFAQEPAFAGSGAEGDPYLITTAEEMQTLAGLVNAADGGYVSAHYKLTADLDFASYDKAYQPVGTASNPFCGVFDGNGFVLSDIANTTDSETMRDYGVFGALGEGASVKNLGVNKIAFTNTKAWSENAMGGIAGRIVGNASIENCYTTGCDFNVFANAQDKGSGGIAGLVKSGAALTVKNCYSTAITGYYTQKSGIVYCDENSGTASLTNCYSVAADTSRDATKISKTNCYLGEDPDLAALGTGFFADESYQNNGMPVLSINLLYQGKINGTLASGSTINIRNHKFTDLTYAAGLVPFSIDWYQSADKSAWTRLATGMEYTLSDNEIGCYIKAVVTIGDGGGALAVYSQNKVAPAAQTPSVSAVTVEGEGAPMHELTAGVLAEEGCTFRYQWEYSDDGQVWRIIDGAVGASYTVGYEQIGKSVRVTVTPVLNGIAGADFRSDPVAVTGDADVAQLFVSADGDDANPGSQQAPVRTLPRAQQLARNALGSGFSAAVVNIRGGEYFIPQAIALQQPDSGTTYRAYNGENVILTGGQKIDNSKITKVTDQSVLARVIDANAREKLMQIDLEGVELRELTDYYGQGIGGYRQQEIYVNGFPLTYARWPNNAGNDTFLTTAGVQAGEEVTDPASFTYEDPTNRAQNHWSEKTVETLYAAGYMSAPYFYSSYKVTGFDFKTGRATICGANNSQVGKINNNTRVFFWNLLEEIDLPGEMFIDRENKVAYLYPNADMDSAEVFVPSLTSPMFEGSSASNVKLEGLRMEYSLERLIRLDACDSVVVDGCTLAHTSGGFIGVSNCTNTVIQNCHMYDAGDGGVNVSNPVRLESYGNKILNNRIHDANRVYKSYVPAMACSSSGLEVKNNELYNASHMLISCSAPNVLFEGNNIHHAVTEASDMGAVYWNYSLTNMGIRFIGNYFHDIGNTYEGHATYGAQSIFADDGSIAPQVTGNVFYKASTSSTVVKTHGAQFGSVDNNIFIDSPDATVLFQRWNVTGYKNEVRWWLAWQDCYENVTGKWESAKQYLIDSGEWREYFRGTQWEPAFHMFTEELHQQAAALKAAGDKKALYEFADQYAPSPNNTYTNNLLVNTKKTTTGGGGVESGTILKDSSVLAGYENGNFSLSQAGLASVQAENPSFQDVDFSRMGLREAVINGKTMIPGGVAPTVRDMVLTESDGSLKLNYAFADGDGDEEGFTRYHWYSSDSKDGKFKLIDARGESALPLDSSYKNKYVYCEVTPYDANGLMGETVASAVVQVGKNAGSVSKLLQEAIDSARELQASVGTGEAFGQTSVAAHTALEQAIAAAEGAGGDDDALYQAWAVLEEAIRRFEDSVSQDTQKLEDVNNVQPFMQDLTFNLSSDASISVPTGEALPGITVNYSVTVDGAKAPASLTIERGTVVRADTERVRINLFGESGTPGAAMENAEKITSLKLTDGQIDSDKPVVLRISQAGNKKTGYINNGRFTAFANTTLGSKKYGRSKVGDDLQIDTTALGEIVLYTSVSPDIDPTSQPIPTPGYGGGSGGGGVYTGGGAGNPIGVPGIEQTPGNRARFADTIGHWAQSDIEEMASKGIVTGVTETTFEPDRSITRAEFATLVTKALGLTSNASAGFEDVPDNEWYYPYVNAAASAGIITGYDGLFRPDDRITREEMAVILGKAYAFMEKSVEHSGIDRFTDSDTISKWAFDSVGEATAAGLISGMPDGSFAPRENATRAQAASVIRRLLDQ